jgi:formate/nitrite transporter
METAPQSGCGTAAMQQERSLSDVEAVLDPQQIAAAAAKKGTAKANLPVSRTLVLGFLAGAFIALGYLLAIRVTSGLPESWGSLPNLITASVFPLGLVLVLLAGGELLTGNMMSVSIARLTGGVNTRALLKNMLLVTVGNFAGAVFVAFCFSHALGLLTEGIYLARLTEMARHKLADGFARAFLSGIGCNWLVGLAVWLAYGSASFSGKVLGIWFPTMAFVAIGFQHVVANMFLLPAAVFEGVVGWGETFANFVPVWLGNFTGGALFVACAYWFAYLRDS